jgi:hypothetical protein
VSWEAQDLGSQDGMAAIALGLKTRSSNLGALRPAVLLEAAFATNALECATLDSMRVLRCGQWHENEEGRLVEALDEGLLA